MDITFITRAAGSGERIGRFDTVAVIDVLRATSCMVRAVESGAEQIIPVKTPEEARILAAELPRGETVLAGEQNGREVDGFDLFNSPGLFSPEAVGGKTVIMSTSNGTGAVLEASRAARVLICALTNVDAVARRCRGVERLAVLCSGNGNRICSEDLLCGGVLLELLKPELKEEGLEDASRISMLLAENYGKDPLHLLRRSERGRALIRMGYEEDLIFCADRDSSRTVPFLRNGEITNRAVRRYSMPAGPFLYAILDRSLIGREELVPAAERLAEGGADLVQYRGKDIPEEEKLRDIRRIIPVLERRGVPLIVNDSPELALETDAAGVHLGSEDPSPATARAELGPGALIGVTVHSFEELERAGSGDINYISAGSIFPSSTKPEVKVKGSSFLAGLRERTDLPLVAIGGITTENAAEALRAGADGIAAVSAVLKGDIEKNCFTFRRIIDRNKR